MGPESESESGVVKFSNPGVGVGVPQKNKDSTSLVFFVRLLSILSVYSHCYYEFVLLIAWKDLSLK